MTRSPAEDNLRAEYFDLLPDIRKVTEELETRVRYAVLDTVRSRKEYELVVVKPRVKECQSAINAVKRRQEGNTFDDSLRDSYTLTSLKDLAGVRLLVFPSTKVAVIDAELKRVFSGWDSDPVYVDAEPRELLAHKYYGYCMSSKSVRAEYQIVPMLIGLFWDVEHGAIYKPAPRLLNIARSLEMQEKKENVYRALTEFTGEFQNQIEEALSSD